MSRAWISGWAVAAALGALTLGVSPSAQAEAGSLDIRGWLDRPGVKLLAVEFYATWCEPCMAAVPRWKELHERYRQQGLRLVVVATQDPEGGCVNPGWNPDDVICDDEGQLARMMGAGDRLPAAFLWSWQGNLLVRKGHVEEVEKGIEEWMKASPRVDVRVQGVAEGSGVGRAELRDLVRNEIGRSAKLTVVASEEERKRLDAVRRRSFAERFDDDSRCELGKELSPNSLLDVKVYGSGSRKRLRLGLLSLERGCLVGSAVVDWNRRRPEIAVAEAVAELVQKLRPSIQMPRGRDLAHASGPSSFEEDIGERVEAWEPEAGGSRVIVSFRSEPPGVVLLDGNLLCQDTSRGCSRALAKGSYTVTMQRERYKKRIERLRVEAPTELDWALEPNFGTYAVRSDPSDLEVEIDGVSKGRTPLEGVELAPGRHEILVTDPCFYRRGKRISAKAGERRELAFEMKPRLGALDIVAVDRSGNAQRGEAWIDGVRVGAVPAVHKAPVCARTLEIKRANGTVAYRGPLAVKEKQLIHVRATVDGAEDAREADRGRVLVYMNDGDVDTRVVPQAEGTALIESVRASRKVTTFTRFDRVAARLSDHGAVVVPELESGRPELSSADAGALRAFVRKGGVMVTVLDDPKKARSLGLLEDIFGWRLRSDGSPKGSRAARTTEARRLGLAGPPSLPLNNDTDVLLATSLPEGAVPLYVDEDDRSVVTMLPFGKGHVAVLGWDWYDAKPRGRVDGGWLNVLRGLLDARVEEAPPPPAPPPAPSGRSMVRDVALYASSAHVDYGSDPAAEGPALEAALVAAGHRVSRFTRFQASSLSGRNALVLPDLEKGKPKLGRQEQRLLRAFVEEGGDFVAVLDESGKDRAASLLNELFGWRLAVKATPSGERPLLRAEAARKVGFVGPSEVDINNDTDALLKSSLPVEAEVVYADSQGDPVVSVIPRGRGRVVVLGWDWYDGAPRGKQDGGWLEVLRGVMGLRRAPPATATTRPDTYASTVAPPPGARRGRLLFMGEAKFADMRVGEKGAEGANLLAVLQGQGFTVDPVSLGSLRDAYSRTAKYRAVVVPELAKGTPREIARAVRPARKYLRSYVKKGGTLLVTLDQVDKSRVFEVLRQVFGWSGLRSNKSVSGPIALSPEVGAKLGLRGLPSSLTANNDTDTIVARSLPRGSQALYADGAGNAALAVLPYGRGQVFILGWDWYNAQPIGEHDGGWNRALSALLR